MSGYVHQSLCVCVYLSFSLEIERVVHNAQKELTLEHQFLAIQEEWMEKVSAGQRTLTRVFGHSTHSK